jgi:unsaturated pyranuronate lyase
LAGFDDLRGLPVIQVWDTVVARTIHGDRQSLAVVELDPKQLGMVISGALTFRIADETRELGPGETWTIPSNVPHEVTAGPQGAVVIDVFAPVRVDWEEREKSEPRQPRWPE